MLQVQTHTHDSKNIVIALAQINSHLADLKNNIKLMLEYVMRAKNNKNAGIIVFPEFAICGYPPQDLLLRNEFLMDIEHAVAEFNSKVSDILCIVSYPKLINGKLYNHIEATYNNTLVSSYQKINLPNYTVFDEKRYFCSGINTAPSFIFKGIKCQLAICEDIWNKSFTDTIADTELILCANASPFHINKPQDRIHYITKIAVQKNTTIAYSNLVGGQDELVFDGNSFMVNKTGEILIHGKNCQSDLITASLSPEKYPQDNIKNDYLIDVNLQTLQVIQLGLRDYLTKNNFTQVVVGLSGGIDSAVTAAIAAQAIGSKNVVGIMLKTKFTSKLSLDLSQKLADNLNINYHVIDIQYLVIQNIQALQAAEIIAPCNLVIQNIQARVRANLLMAYANQYERLLLTTGNKSEIAMGYCTLYGDMAGGFNLIGDLFKSKVYDLANFINLKDTIIPKEIVTRPPTAELDHNQLDSDTLPSYDVLDNILTGYMDDSLSIKQIIDTYEYDEKLVNSIIRRLHSNQHKRYQASIGVRLTQSSFYKDWRYPLSFAK